MKPFIRMVDERIYQCDGENRRLVRSGTQAEARESIDNGGTREGAARKDTPASPASRITSRYHLRHSQTGGPTCESWAAARSVLPLAIQSRVPAGE